MRLHDEQSGFSPSSVHMPRIKKGQLIHRFDVLRQNVLCVWAIALSASEQVSRETMENNRVRRASTRAVACQRLGPVLEEWGGVGVAHGILGRNSSVEVRRIAGITETPAPVEESIIYSARIQDLSLCIFHVGALPDGGRRVVLF